jgi:hypothetical protein
MLQMLVETVESETLSDRRVRDPERSILTKD